jgi:hypothetical protein
MTDERLDRLIDRLLAERAEDVASIALPADLMAERIATGLRPASQLRTGFALVAALLLLLVALAAAVVIGSRPAPAVLVTFECEASAPEFAGEHLDPIAVQDATGMVTGCREVGSVEAGVIRDTFGPPMPDFLDDTSLEITKASDDDTRLLVIWILRGGCDRGARIALNGEAPNRIDLVVNQDLDGPCAPGTGLRAVEIGFDQPLAPGNVSGILNRVQSGP